ncbi:MAG: hypothetical protein KA408_10420 [Flavobacteriales bacterium]|nr:hypothetical protein [Flavobacteriales bacterium]
MNTHLKEIYAVTLPEPITRARVAFLIQERRIDPAIAAIDLGMVKRKLQDAEEGKGWSADQCDEHEVAYKRYLHLCKLHGKGMVPTKDVDEFWHQHIMDTRAYQNDCQEAIGHFVHHFPYLGMRGEEDERQLEKAFRRTEKLYCDAFGEALLPSVGAQCWHDCSGRCWNDCSSK